MSSTVIFSVGLVLSIAGLLGVAYAVFKSAAVTKTIELLEVENNVLSKSITRQTADINVLQEKVATLERDNRTLGNMVTGRVEIAALTEHVHAEEAFRKQEHAVMMTALAEVKDLLQELFRAIPRLLAGDK